MRRILIVLTVSLLAVSCSKDENPSAPVTPPAVTDKADSIREAQSLIDEPAMIGDLNAAAGYYIDNLQLKINPRNVVFSPVALMTGMEMMQFGAKGTSRISGHSVKWNWGEEYFRMHRRLVNRLGGRATFASSVWYSPAQNIQQSYFDILKKFLFADAFAADLSSQTAWTSMQQWLNGKTDGVGTPLAQPAPGETAVLLTLAAFTAQWHNAVEVNQISTLPFHFPDSSVKDVPFLQFTIPAAHGGLYYDADPVNRYRGVSMPLGDGALSMAVVQADCGCPYAVIPIMAPVNKQWATVVKRFTAKEINLRIPAVQFASDEDPTSYLRQYVKLKDAFTEDADFSGMDSTKSLRLSSILNRSSMTLSQSGITANGASSTGMTHFGKQRATDALDITIDRPFLILVYEKATGIILLEAVIMQP